MIPLKLVKRIALVIVILVVVILVIFLSWRYVFFNLVHENPGSKTLPTSQTTLVYTFNHSLNKSSSATIKGTAVKYRVAINGSILRIVLSNQLNENVNFSVTISATSGDNHLNITREYTTKYLEFKDLTKEEQERQITESSGVEKDYPLVKHLPVITPDFEIDYIIPDENEKLMSLTVLCKKPDFNNLLGDESVNDNVSCLGDAKEYLSGIGYDDTKYVILSDIKSRDYELHHD